MQVRRHLAFLRRSVDEAAQLVIRVGDGRFHGNVIAILQGWFGRLTTEIGEATNFVSLAGTLHFLPNALVDLPFLDELCDRRTILLVAFDAVLIEDWLNLAFEGKAARRSIERFDLTWRALRRKGTRGGRRSRNLGLVASDAGDRFAGERRDPAAHNLQRATVFVERLEKSGYRRAP